MTFMKESRIISDSQKENIMKKIETQRAIDSALINVKIEERNELELIIESSMQELTPNRNTKADAQMLEQIVYMKLQLKNLAMEIANYLKYLTAHRVGYQAVA